MAVGFLGGGPGPGPPARPAGGPACRLARAELLQPGRPPGSPRAAAAPTPGRPRTWPATSTSPRVGLPPGALLRPEQPVGGLRPVQRRLRLRRGQRAVGRRQQQLGLLGGPAPGLLDVTDARRSASASASLASPAASRTVAPVQAERGHRHVQRPVPGGGLVEDRTAPSAGRRTEKAADGPVEHRVDRLQLLAGFGEQAPGGDEVGVRAAGRARAPGTPRPRRSAPGPSRADHPARRSTAIAPAQVVQGRRVPAQGPQHDAAPVPAPGPPAHRWTAARPDQRRPGRPLFGPRRPGQRPGWPARPPRARASRSPGPAAAPAAVRGARPPGRRIRAARCRRPGERPTPRRGWAARPARHGPGPGPPAAGTGPAAAVPPRAARSARLRVLHRTRG